MWEKLMMMNIGSVSVLPNETGQEGGDSNSSLNSGWSPNNKEAQGEGDKEGILADTVPRKDQKVSMDGGERHKPCRKHRRMVSWRGEGIPSQ